VPTDGLTVFFLFTGDKPLDLTVLGPVAQQVRVVPQPAANPRIFQRMMNRWWREYHAAARRQASDGDYPPIVQTYLTSMLSRRLRLAPPLLSRLTDPGRDEPLKTLELLAGVESLRMATLRRTSLGQQAPFQVADVPLPHEIPWNSLEPPAAAEDIAVEPMAMRVPQEWFYVRFGNFDNFLWVDRLQREYGGDIGRMITLRGFDARLNERMETQLVVEQNLLAELLGPTMIADVALVGRDLFQREGAAVGLLFQARTPLFGSGLDLHRANRHQAESASGARIENVQLAGHDVSFLSTPDNRLRSYYVVDGDYHLVTSSRAMAERFLLVRDGRGTLGTSGEFLHARTVLPVDREDTVFAFFSSAFFQGLISPQYQIELRRRLQAVTDLELVQLARWAAHAEGERSDTIDALVEGGLLPEGFGRRTDGSTPLLTDGAVVDSLRGRRGSFAPIPDITIDRVTRAESQRLLEQSQFYRQSWPQMDPLMAGVKRYALDAQGRERIVVDAYVSPFAEHKYGWLMSLLGPPTSARIAPAPGDIITAQASVKGGLFLPQIPLHHLFLGIQDSEPLTDLPRGGLLQALAILQATPGYLGAWPKTGFLDALPLGLGGTQPDSMGYSQLPLGIWRRQWDAFSVLSPDPDILAHASHHVVPENADNDAQVRVRIGDLSQARLRSWVNSLNHSRAYQASAGNAKLLHALSQQLAVPPEDALTVAEQLLDARLVCPLGGRYQLNATEGRAAVWKSDGWPETRDAGPSPDYRAPILQWFRGLEAGLTKRGDRLVLHAELDMQRKPSEPKVELPSFFSIFGNRKQAPSDKPLPEPPTEAVPAPKGKKL
jgi:hypothetical protein